VSEVFPDPLERTGIARPIRFNQVGRGLFEALDGERRAIGRAGAAASRARASATFARSALRQRFASLFRFSRVLGVTCLDMDTFLPLLPEVR